MSSMSFRPLYPTNWPSSAGLAKPSVLSCKPSLRTCASHARFSSKKRITALRIGSGSVSYSAANITYIHMRLPLSTPA